MLCGCPQDLPFIVVPSHYSSLTSFIIADTTVVIINNVMRYVNFLLSGALNVPMLFTSHSLGQDKLEQLLKQGQLLKDEINTTYKIMHRIEAEELALNGSEIVFTSTIQEIEGQWRLYDGFDPVLERKLRARIRRNVSCYGRFMPRMAVSTGSKLNFQATS